MGVSETTLDLEAVRSGLARWLGRTRRGVSVAPLTRPSAGLSSETLFVDASWEGGAGSWVARLPPSGGGIFPAYDLALQARLQDVVPEFGVPTAAPCSYEPDVAWVGSPFVLMPRVDGLLLADNPPFAREGWLHDGGGALQETVYRNFVETMAAVHRVPVASVSWAARDGGPGLRSELAWWSAHVTWAGGPPELVAAVSWLAAHVPSPEPPPSLIWGDVRLGNVIFSPSGSVRAVLDWEMASVGPAEVDLGWFLAIRELLVGPDRVELPGFLSRADTIALYASLLGRPVGDLLWYEVFALVRSASILVRMQQLLGADHWLAGIDPVPPRVRSLVGASSEGGLGRER